MTPDKVLLACRSRTRWRVAASLVACLGYTSPVLADTVAACIRFVATSEVNGRAWTSVAEIDLLNAAGQPLAKTGWTLVSTDSQETVAEDGRATNAFDGNTTTIWHTQWQQASPPHPHRIDINLGSSQTLSALQYLPRQAGQGSINGTIAGYEVYASQNCSSWVRVAQGTWPNNRDRKTAQLSSGNALPTVSVTAPANGAVFAPSAMINFAGTASDSEDGNLSAGISWRSNVSGLLGTGATLSTSLPVGTHVVTASVTDSGSQSASASITVIVGTPPAQPLAMCVRLVAVSEVNGRAWTSGAEVDVLDGAGQRLSRTAWSVSTDSQEIAAEDGRALNAIDGATGTMWHTQWQQASPPPPHRLDLNLGSLQTVSGLEYLPRQDSSVNGTIAGYEVYTSIDCASWALVSQGTWANNKNRKTAAFTTGGNAAPSVTVTAPANNATFSTSDVITFTGTASDAEDGNLSAGIRWQSNVSGLLGTGASLSTSLVAGTHTVTASVTDSGSQTRSATVTVVVVDPSTQIVARCVRLVALSEVNGRPWTSVAEIDVLNAAGQRLSKTGWTLGSVDSQETAAEDGRASNAFDGSTSTIWHTQWSAASPPPPHYIEINLGSPQVVTGLEYLPRQDGSQNGTIAQYEVYTSSSCTSWARVAQGTWPNSAARKSTPPLVDAGIPTANAGADRTVVAPTTVTLDGSASTDVGGTITAYLWSQTAGPAVTLATPNAVTASFTTPLVTVQTLFTFQLRVTDNSGNNATDTVNITVNPEPGTTPVLSFQDITATAGVGGPATFGGHGGMFSDVNNDGLPDLYVTMNQSGTQMAELFFLNLGAGQFREEASTRGIANLDSGSHGGVWADFDNDGDLGLFNGSFDQNRLYRNGGTGNFTDVTFASGISALASSTRAALAFDMENDGDLDIFAVNGFLGNDDPAAERNEIYRNDGNHQFTPIVSGALYTALVGQGATAVDFDNDGDIDVFAANRTGPIAVLRNNGAGTFTQVDAATLGLQPEGLDGITFADVNNDGFLDVMLSQALYVHNGTSGYVRRQVFDTGTYHYMGGFADLDNDRDFDLVFPGANRVYLNDGAGNFTPSATFSIGTIDDPRSVSFADIEQDGDLDFFYAQKWALNRMVRNDLASTNRWIKVSVRAPNGQRNPYGARVYVYDVGGLGNPSQRVAWWELRSQDGYLSQQDGVVHLGVGTRQRVAVRVVFLGGATLDYPDVPTNAWVQAGP